MHEAVADVKAKRLSIYQAAKLYKIPRKMLSSYVKNADQPPPLESEKKYKKYKKSDLINAMAEMKENGMSLHRAARLYKIPRTTFSRYVKKAGHALTKSKSREIDRTKHNRSNHVNKKTQPQVKHLNFREAAKLYKISLLESLTNIDDTAQWSIKVRMTHRGQFEIFKR